jgi:hypothetical protein
LYFREKFSNINRSFSYRREQLMATQPKPEHVKLSAADADTLRARIQANNLTDEDRRIILGLISFSLWLEQQLHSAKLSIQRLKKLFGFSSEKKTPK